MKKHAQFVVLALSLVLASAGCGSDGGGTTDPGLTADVPAGTDGTTVDEDATVAIQDDHADLAPDVDDPLPDATSPDLPVDAAVADADDVAAPPVDATDEGQPADLAVDAGKDAGIEDAYEAAIDATPDLGVEDVPTATDPGIDATFPTGFFPAVPALGVALVGTWASGNARTTFDADGTGVDFDTDTSKPRYCFEWTVNPDSQRLVREYKDLDGKDCDNYDDPNFAWAQWEDVACADATRLSFDCLFRTAVEPAEGPAEAAIVGTWERSWSFQTDEEMEFHQVTLVLDDDLTLLMIYQVTLVIGDDAPLTDEYLYEGLWEYANGELTLLSDGQTPPMPHEGTWNPLFGARPGTELLGMNAAWSRVP